MRRINAGRYRWRVSSQYSLVTAMLISVSPVSVYPTFADDVGGTWLDTITVVGTRTERAIRDNPRSVAVVTADEIARRSTDSVAELLRDVPGVEIADDSVAGMKRLRIRGESSRRVTILVDGQEITDHSTFGTPILVDPATIERIEVVKGPSSVLHGAKAIGGVVNIITKKGAHKPIQLDTGGTYHSGTAGWQSYAAVSGSKDGFDYRLSGTVDRHGNRTVPVGQYSTYGELDDTSFGNSNLYGHVGYRFGLRDNHYLALKVEQHQLESEGWVGPPGAFEPGQRFRIDLPQRDRRKIGLYYDGEDISDIVSKIHLDVYYQTIDRLFKNEVVTPVSRGPRQGTMEMKLTSDDRITNYGVNAQIDLDLLEGHQTIVGAQYLSDNLVTTKDTRTTLSGFAPVPVRGHSLSRDEAHIDTFSLYLQDEWSLTDDVRLISGLRLNHLRTGLDETTVAERSHFEGTTDTRLLSSLGMIWEPLDTLALRASYSEGYISPTLLQLFSSTDAGGEGTTYGNPNLDMELARNFEIGARYENAGLTFDVAGFYTRSKDYITTTRCVAVTEYCLTAGTGRPSSIYVNADRATTFGLEFLAEYEMSAGFTPYVSGSWIRRELEQATYSTFNSDTPALSGRIGVRYEGAWQEMPIWADLFVRGATGSRETYFDAGNLVTDQLPGWGTLNFAFGGVYGEDQRLTFSVHLNNIFDKEYRPTFGELPGTGRSIEVSARMKF